MYMLAKCIRASTILKLNNYYLIEDNGYKLSNKPTYKVKGLNTFWFQDRFEIVCKSNIVKLL